MSGQGSQGGPGGTALRAFAGYGIELEYAIVARDTLDVRALAPQLLGALARDAPGGAASVSADDPVACDVQRGTLGWSNELVAHVVELKNLAPVATLAGMATRMHGEIAQANAALAGVGAALLPGGMHPWMDPARETTLWRHGGAAIYAAYDRIFDCRCHGFANVQSMHVNLPFGDDEELARLHAAVRAVLPLVPALAASSPFADGRRAPGLDHRLAVYRTNSDRVPEVTGAVIPEDVDGAQDYQARILAPLYEAIAPHDPDGVLAHEWLNARGAIVRFDRQAIEIRLCDTQECPAADLAIAAAVCGAVRALYEERWCDIAALRALETGRLAAILGRCELAAEDARIDDLAYLAAFGLDAPAPAGRVWTHLVGAAGDAVLGVDPDAAVVLDFIAAHGTLATRLVRAAGERPTHATLLATFARLRDCLGAGTLFDGEP